MIQTGFEKLEALCRVNAGMDDVKAIINEITTVRNMSPATPADVALQNKRIARLHARALGNLEREPIMSFLTPDLMNRFDAAYTEVFNDGTPGARLTPVELAISTTDSDSAHDNSEVASKINQYLEGMIGVARGWVKQKEEDPSATNIEKLLAKQLEGKLRVFLTFSCFPLECIPWMPLITNASLYMFYTRLSLTPDAIQAVS